MPSTISITSAFKTNIGLVRKENQDSVSTHDASEFDSKIDGLFVVADGMGGMAGGAVASRLTVETIPAIVSEALEDRTDPLTERQLASLIRDAVETANDTVWTQAKSNPELRGMGTTVVTVAVLDDKALLASVGDSRIYLCRGGVLSQITHDHSLVAEQVRSGQLTAEEARNSRYSNVITRAIGIAAVVEPELQLLELHEGDTLLLCTDGLTNMVEFQQIANVIGTTSDLEKACETLVDLALKGGGKDNVTVNLVRYGPFVPAIAVESNSPQHGFLGNTRENSPSAATSMIIQAAPRKRSYVSTIIAIAALAALGFVLPKAYNFSKEAPFLTPKPPVIQDKLIVPPKTDYAHLEYDKAVVVSKKLLNPFPVVVNAAGNIVAISRESGVAVSIAPDGKFKRFGPPDIGAESNPSSLYWVMDPQGNLYVSKKSTKAIYKFDPAGTRIGTVGEGELKGPEGIAISESGSLYVVDAGILKVFKSHAPSPKTSLTSAPSTPIDNTPQIGASDRPGSNGNASR